eukprot:COSAG01_NODE_5604_length_4152_cov_2.350851_6_plen_47_part_00
MLVSWAGGESVGLTHRAPASTAGQGVVAVAAAAHPEGLACIVIESR